MRLEKLCILWYWVEKSYVGIGLLFPPSTRYVLQFLGRTKETIDIIILSSHCYLVGNGMRQEWTNSYQCLHQFLLVKWESSSFNSITFLRAVLGGSLYLFKNQLAMNKENKKKKNSGPFMASVNEMSVHPVNKENTYYLVISPLTQIEFKSSWRGIFWYSLMWPSIG
jgi:hypothetical protein